MSTSERETMIRIRVLSLVPAPWTRGSAKITTKITRHDVCPEQNEVSHLHGLVQPLRKVARSVFNTLDWNGKANMISLNTLIYPSKNIHHCNKKKDGRKKKCQDETSNITAALVNIWTPSQRTHLHIWYIFEAYLRSMCLPSELMLLYLSANTRTACRR